MPVSRLIDIFPLSKSLASFLSANFANCDFSQLSNGGFLASFTASTNVFLYSAFFGCTSSLISSLITYSSYPSSPCSDACLSAASQVAGGNSPF